MIILFTTELKAFISVKTSSELLVDLNRSADFLSINLDITMTKLPCSIISVDVQDIMGNHSLNVHGKILKYRLDKNGKELGATVELKDKNSGEEVDMPDYDEVKKAIISQEGCTLKGQVKVLRVPGNFHISSHAYSHIIQRLSAEGLYKFDISHKIQHLSFGSEDDIVNIKKTFDVGILGPMDGVSKIHTESSKTYEYYLKVVPTTYVDVDGNKYSAHQFTSNSNEVVTNVSVPTIYFRYDISPILVKIEQTHDSFFHFFIQICAIIGGMYTVTGILDSIFYKMFIKDIKTA